MHKPPMNCHLHLASIGKFISCILWFIVVVGGLSSICTASYKILAGMLSLPVALLAFKFFRCLIISLQETLVNSKFSSTFMFPFIHNTVGCFLYCFIISSTTLIFEFHQLLCFPLYIIR